MSTLCTTTHVTHCHLNFSFFRISTAECLSYYWFGELRHDVINAMLANHHAPFEIRQKYTNLHNKENPGEMTNTKLNKYVWSILEPIVTKYSVTYIRILL